MKAKKDNGKNFRSRGDQKFGDGGDRSPWGGQPLDAYYTYSDPKKFKCSGRSPSVELNERHKQSQVIGRQKKIEVVHNFVLVLSAFGG